MDAGRWREVSLHVRNGYAQHVQIVQKGLGVPNRNVPGRLARATRSLFHFVLTLVFCTTVNQRILLTAR